MYFMPKMEGGGDFEEYDSSIGEGGLVGCAINIALGAVVLSFLMTPIALFGLILDNFISRPSSLVLAGILCVIFWLVLFFAIRKMHASWDNIVAGPTGLIIGITGLMLKYILIALVAACVGYILWKGVISGIWRAISG